MARPQVCATPSLCLSLCLQSSSPSSSTVLLLYLYLASSPTHFFLELILSLYLVLLEACLVLSCLSLSESHSSLSIPQYLPPPSNQSLILVLPPYCAPLPQPTPFTINSLTRSIPAASITTKHRAGKAKSCTINHNVTHPTAPCTRFVIPFNTYPSTPPPLLSPVLNLGLSVAWLHQSSPAQKLFVG